LVNGLTPDANSFLINSGQMIQQHPKRLAAVLVALLVGGAGGAFAVANLAPDASDLPVRQVLETVEPLPLLPQAQALEFHDFRLFRSETTRSTDSADSLLGRLGINDTAAAAFIRADGLARQVLLGRGGRNVTVEAGDDNTLFKLSARWNADDEGHFKRLVIERSAQGFKSRVETGSLTASTRLASGTIQSSLFAATDEAKIPDAVAVQLAEIFAGDVDFHRSLRKGDRFSVVYETLEGDGEPMRSGRVLSAEFVNRGKTYQAVWFQSPLATGDSGTATAAGTPPRGGYYTLDGQSLRRAYLASPMEFSRVSSTFKMRFHPILQKWRAHLGVDYAAPTGTAVRSVGDGVVEFAGVQNGFGNVVMVKHRNNHSTVYAHLSRISVRKGQNVSQGQNVGAVGATGWATGPHLHFEFRVNGAHQDPLTLAKNSETIPVPAAAKTQFDRAASFAKLQLGAAATILLSSAQ
jgi:murein DD-endopeptidase MepM/ murein hydrolase activator NlpD